MEIRLYSSEDLNLVEFSYSTGQDGFSPMIENSKYLHAAVFCLIQKSFELSKPDFRYNEATSYLGQELVTLRNRLVDQISRIRNIDSPEELESYSLNQAACIDFLNELKMNNPTWKINWENIKDQVLKVTEELLELVDFCIDEEKVFWIKGY